MPDMRKEKGVCGMSAEKESAQSSELTILDAPDFQMDVKYVAEFMGIEVEEVAKLRLFPKPNKAGIYPFTRTMVAMGRHLRQQRDEITNKELAELCGVSPSRISIMEREGTLPEKSDGHYARWPSLVAVFRWMRGRVGIGENTATKAKADKAHLENRLMQIKIEREEGKALDIRIAERLMSERVLTAREKLMRVGNKLGGQAAFWKDANEAEAAIRREIEEACEELSRPIEWEDPEAESGNEDGQ